MVIGSFLDLFDPALRPDQTNPKTCHSCDLRAVCVPLGLRYSSTFLAISVNRLAIRTPSKARDGRREAAPSCSEDEGGVLLSH